jgi:hypothetical protein
MKTTSAPIPPCTPTAALDDTLKAQGFAVLPAAAVRQWVQPDYAALETWLPHWGDLPSDNYLKDGGHYRRRRHSCFVVDADRVTLAPHRAHWQPLQYNALHGGMQRWFEPMAPEMVAHPAWHRLMVQLAAVASALRAPQPWYVEAHQFRIDTTDGIGRPTPEGAHRDGVDLVAVFMLGRQRIKGAETRVFEADGPNGQRFTLSEPWSVLLLDDARVIHESTPIQPLEEGELGWRDTLVVTLRRGGFQGE